MNIDTADPFLTSRSPLRAGDAVAAILVLEDGRYILQLRDALPQIWFPSHWGLFGGGIDSGETALTALVRELREELEFTIEPTICTWFTDFDFDFRPFGQTLCRRFYFTVPVTHTQMASFTLREGAAVRAFTAEEIFSLLRVTPYDSFALWLHSARHRLESAAFTDSTG